MKKILLRIKKFVEEIANESEEYNDLIIEQENKRYDDFKTIDQQLEDYFKWYQDNILDYLYLLTLPFEYLPTDNDILECQKLFSKNYEEEFVDTFMNIMLKNKQLFIEKNTISNDRLDDKVNKLIDTLAWWIPVRKWRDNFRNKFFR